MYKQYFIFFPYFLNENFILERRGQIRQLFQNFKNFLRGEEKHNQSQNFKGIYIFEEKKFFLGCIQMNNFKIQKFFKEETIIQFDKKIEYCKLMNAQ